MTQEEIIRMAREAANCLPGYTSKVKDPKGAVLEFYMAFAKLVAAAEREALASEAERNGNTILAMQIRARGQQ